MNPLVDIAVALPTWYALYQRYAFAAGPYSPYIGAALPDLLARLDGEAQGPPGNPFKDAATPAVAPVGMRDRLPDWDPSPSRLLIVDVPAEEGVDGASALLAQHTFPVFAWPGPSAMTHRASPWPVASSPSWRRPLASPAGGMPCSLTAGASAPDAP
ncbi:hypothetical protein [Calditerricola satsumensis]|uniref:hypothetical protein n=1 Tax=Calditerricola satsumensis TaxID=373054 RepID=UPI0006D1A917|nr:hypothetical protein [Calditerricola satsumensis]